MTANYQTVDLDKLLSDAERRARNSRAELEKAEKVIRVLQERIESYDKSHA